AADDDRRVRRLERLRFEHDGTEVEETAVMLDGLLGPEAAADVEGLVQPGAAAGEIEAGRGPLRFQPAGPDADLQAAPRDNFHRLDGPGRDEGMAEPQVVDVG